jgi:hypothetical protein
VRLGRKAPHVPHRTDDPSGQDGTYAEYLSEGGARSFYLGFDAPVEVGDLRIERPDSKRSTSEASRRRRRAEAPLGRMPRRMRAARSAESVLATPPGRRSRRSAWRRFSARVRSATRSISASRRAGASSPRRARDLPQPAFRCARRPARWRGHRLCRSCGRCRSRALAPVPRAWAARPPPTRLSSPTSPPGAYPEPAGVLHRLGRRSGNRLAQRSSDLKPERSCGKLARSRSSLVASSSTAKATDALSGDRPL